MQPSSHIPDSLINIIRNLSAEAEKLGTLHPGQLAVIYREKWFKLFVPKEYGGLELSLPEALHIEEALARADGSTGWTVTLCSGANWFIGFLSPDVADIIFNDPAVCLAGSGRASGTATITPDGYEISGRWDYATGAPHATIFTANCVIEKNGTTLQNAAGNPLVHAFWFYKDEVIIDENWNCMGMIATASHSFEVQQLQVPANRCFIIDHAHAVLPHPVYQFPFLQFAETTLAVNSSGMALHFLELCGKLLADNEQKEKFSPKAVTHIRTVKEDVEKKFQSSRQLFYTAVEKAWLELVNNKSIEVSLLNDVSLTSRTLAAEARNMVDTLYPYCGIIAATPSSEINRVWRDIHTASQHTLLTIPQ